MYVLTLPTPPLMRKQLEAFKPQKKGLMQKLLSGQVRVKLAEGGA